MKRMLKTVWQLLLSLSLALVLSSCSGGGGGGGGATTATQATIIPQTTKVLSSATLNQMTAVSADGATLTFNNSASDVSNLHAGDVIVGDAATSVPSGILRKVVSVTPGTNGVAVSTVATTLEESIQRATLNVNSSLAAGNLVSATALQKGVSFKKAARNLPPVIQINNVVLYDGDGSNSTTNDQVVANGSVTLNPSFNFNIEIDNFKIKNATFTNTMVETAQITVSANAEHSLAKEVELAKYEFAPITVWAGYVPVVITPVLKVVVGANGQVSVGMSSSVTQQATLTAGLHYENGAWAPISQNDNTFSYEPPTINANASAKVYAGPQLELMLYGVAGPYANIKGYLGFDADITTNPWWTLSGGLEANLGMKMDVLGHSIADYSEKVLDIHKVLAQAQSSHSERGALLASVKDAVTGNVLSGVTVNVSKQGSTVASGTTDATGAVSLTVDVGIAYNISFTRTGYMTVNYSNVSVAANINNYLAAVLQIDNSHSGPGNVSGSIVNAFTGQGISGLTVALRVGINATSGTTFVQGTTSTGGTFSFSQLAAGNYTAEVAGQGFTTAHFTIISIGGITTGNQNYSLTPILPAGQTRIVLTWGATPFDLDSHLTGPDPRGGRFHTYFSNRTFSSGSSVIADLDLDDTSSYGPETTTIYSQMGGIYRFSVHDYSNQSSTTSTVLANSGAKVTVYRGSTIVAIYNVPTNLEGTLWTVFELNGDTLTPINTMAYQSSSASVLRLVIGSVPNVATDANLLRNLPNK